MSHRFLNRRRVLAASLLEAKGTARPSGISHPDFRKQSGAALLLSPCHGLARRWAAQRCHSRTAVFHPRKPPRHSRLCSFNTSMSLTTLS